LSFPDHVAAETKNGVSKEESDNKLKPTIVSALEDEKNDKDEDNNDTIVNHDNDKNEESDNYDNVGEKQGAS